MLHTSPRSSLGTSTSRPLKGLLLLLNLYLALYLGLCLWLLLSWLSDVNPNTLSRVATRPEALHASELG